MCYCWCFLCWLNKSNLAKRFVTSTSIILNFLEMIKQIESLKYNDIFY